MAVHLWTWSSLLLIASFLEPANTNGADWDYTTNGANWGELGQCGAGSPQSPIDVPLSAEVSDDLSVFLKYPKIGSSFQLYHNGYSIAFTLPETYKGGFGLGKDVKDFKKDDASVYRLWQVNFHSPSEHTLLGKKMPLEMQMMHQRVTGGEAETAVVVVLFQDAANVYNDFLEAVMVKGLPKSAWEEQLINQADSPSPLLATVAGGSPFYHYTGSLTVPPCEKGIKYYVRQDPIPAAHGQLSRFTRILKKTSGPLGNFREVQPLESTLTLVPSVDLVRDPDVTVKPTVSKSDSKKEAPPEKAAEPDAPKPKSATECEAESLDQKYSNRHRVVVGEPAYLTKAKEKYNQAQIEVQVTEQSYQEALRNLKFQQGLYDNAPGWAEKINLKWGLVNAQSVEASLKLKKAGMSKYDEPFKADLVKAIHRWCADIALAKQKKEEKERKKAQAAAAAAAAAAPAPAAAEEEEPPKEEEPPEAPLVYPEPHVTLPTGLAASPFTDSSDSSGGAAEGSIEGQRIAPSLKTFDTAPAVSVEEAKKPPAPKLEAPPPVTTEKTLTIDFPIGMPAVGDDANFKADLVDALAKSVNASEHTFTVTRVSSHVVTKVHQGKQAFAQLLSHSRLQLRR